MPKLANPESADVPDRALCELCQLRRRTATGKCMECRNMISGRALQEQREADHFGRMADAEAERVKGPCERCFMRPQLRPNAWCLGCIDSQRVHSPPV